MGRVSGCVRRGANKHNICTLQKESGAHVERLEVVEHVARMDVADVAVTASTRPAMVPPRWAHLCVRPAGMARGYLTGER